MVKPELYKFDKNNQPPRERIIAFQPSVRMERLERAANGAWFAVFRLTMEFAAPPGERTITVDKTMRVRATQEGKLAHPDPFGWKKKAKRRGYSGSPKETNDMTLEQLRALNRPKQEPRGKGRPPLSSKKKVKK